MDIFSRDWMPEAKIQRIHLHWTAGKHQATPYECRHYHILIEGDGTVVRGTYSIANNVQGVRKGRASHTLNANSGAIGVSLCCMMGAKEFPFDPGIAPMTKVQWQVGMKVLAQLAQFYDVPVTPLTILTHAEVGPNLHIMQKEKWDITRLAFDDTVRGYGAVGNLMRREVAIELDKLRGAITHLPADQNMQLPKYKVKGVGTSTLAFRRAPNGEKAGALPEGAIVERLAMDDGWWKVRTKAGYVGWVWSSYLVPA